MSCQFCHRFFTGNPSNELWDTPVVSTPNYLIVPSKGSIVPGWLLVVSTNHELSLGTLNEARRQRILEGVNVAREILANHFGAATVFEHGPSRLDSPLACGINHLHVHVASLSFSLRAATDRLFPQSLSWHACCEQYSALENYPKDRRDYLLLHEPGQMPLHAAPPFPLRQIFRRAIASATGHHELWDYSIAPWRHHAVELLSALAI